MKLSMDKVKSGIFFLIKCILAYMASDGFGTLLRVLVSIGEGQHGAPSFVTPEFTIYGFVSKVLLIIAFLLLVDSIPVNGKLLKGMIFALLYWGSAYLPQVLGMLGGRSKIISQEAFSFGTIFADSVGYILTGIVFGFLFAKHKAIPIKSCSNKVFVLSCITSMLLFPTLLGIFELIGSSIWNQLLCVNAFKIVSKDYKSFYIVFYIFQAVSGLLFPVFYRYTEYNRKQNWIKFSLTYASLLWLPIVIIMAFFGVGLVETILWGIMMIMAIHIDTAIFAQIMNKMQICELVNTTACKA